MLRTILVSLDGSELADRALPFAATLARAAEARLVLVRALGLFELLGGQLTREQEKLRRRVEADVVGQLVELHRDGVRAEAEVLDCGAVMAIRHATVRWDADLIVGSTHGRGGLGRLLYGSVADELVRTSEKPVLLVTPSCGAGWPGDHVRRILVPLDGSALAEMALSVAAELAGALGAPLLLVRIVEPAYYTYYQESAETHERFLAEPRGYLEEIADRLRRGGLAVDVSVGAKLPPWTVAGVAREHEADLVVMATHGCSGLSRLALGSTAAATIGQTTVPVVLVRPADRETDTEPRELGSILSHLPLPLPE
ncbi:MAG: universal stress protein [Chloroflexi bacterium]|nr:universal stress protein [Chloroflexota bacterium]